jgi:membrane protease subunit (stomatin/prohibitin family)
MRILDVIDYRDPSGNELVHRVPENGQADILMGGQLVVQETQSAVFFKDGRAMDVFGPGRHTLSTQNLPILGSLVKLIADGKTPFQAEVYFVNQKVFQDLKWGTPQPIALKDPEIGYVNLRAFGSFSIRISEPQLFVTTIVGTQGCFDTEQLNSFLKGSIRSHLNQVLSQTFQSAFTIRNSFDDLSAAMKVKVKDDFGKYGIELRDFFFQDISLPPEVQQAIDERSKMGILGDLNKYTQYQAAQALRDMAQNPGAGGAAMSMGGGMGMGMMMPQMMQNAFNANQQQVPQQAPPPQQAPVQQAPAPATTPLAASVHCPSCQAPVPDGAKFCMGCGTKMQTDCPSCHSALTPGAKFCMNCGTKV